MISCICRWLENKRIKRKLSLPKDFPAKPQGPGTWVPVGVRGYPETYCWMRTDPVYLPLIQKEYVKIDYKS